MVDQSSVFAETSVWLWVSESWEEGDMGTSNDKPAHFQSTDAVQIKAVAQNWLLLSFTSSLYLSYQRLSGLNSSELLLSQLLTYLACDKIVFLDLKIVQYKALKEILIHIQSYYRTGHCNKPSSIFCQEIWKYRLKNNNKKKTVKYFKKLM